jgi:GWxTD domain-containing protein
MLNQQSGADGRSVSASADLVRQTIENLTVPVGGEAPPGTEAYAQALEYFETATAASPSLPRPWRHRFAALADRKRWEELEVVARQRVSAAPWDAEGWLALGLAQHREGNATALASFDSAFAQMADSTRARLDRVERIMRPKAARILDSLPLAERARTVRFVWTAADPLWSVPGNEVRAEYLARVAFAELRFTDDEKRLHGVDTYPGDLHVRYGFPQLSFNYECGDVCWFWWYAPRLQFVVRYVAAFNRGLSFADDIAGNEDIQFQVPAAWNGIPGVPSIDSIPLRVARFRPDGMRPSVYVSGTIPLQAMSRGGVRGAPPAALLWTFADGIETVGRDSTGIDATGLAVWKLRVPAGEMYTRAEAVLLGGGAARGTAFANAAPTAAGLDMSDVIIAASVADRAAPARRWHELVIAPAPDTLPRARAIDLAWEVYGMVVKDGAQRYTVKLVLEKASKSLAGRIVAQIGGLVGTQRGNERVTLGFERNGAAREVALDHVSLSLSEAPAGRYRLTVEIADMVSGAVVRRGTTLQIAP